MRLIAFRIKNFRSIVDTGWQNISPDNITCLIGQNESGKTSVLEGLDLFFKGDISEDVLRSDMSLPAVYCKFELPDGGVKDRFPDASDGLQDVLGSLESLILVRIWKADLTSELVIGGAVEEYVIAREKQNIEDIESVSDRIVIVSSEFETAQAKAEHLKKEVSQLETEISRSANQNRGLNLFKKREPERSIDPEEREELSKKLETAKSELDKLLVYLGENSGLITSLIELARLRDKMSSIESRMEEISLRLEERHQTMTLLSGPTLKELSRGEWENVLTDYKKITAEKKILQEKLNRQIAVCGFLIDGMQLDSAVLGADKLYEKREKEVTLQQMGSSLFVESPAFEMFEDFGSLLPNRIDLEDIIAENDQVEGYKAARNFLTIAKLDYSFFQQPSTRILKQKIENLNSKLTLDFQDFWQQYVGRKNKIRINFELDHYSTSHGEKAGKPYLEFWVKDEGERLYPKQRSRGVRWFLSFYLELMAASSREKQEMVLLVDEPGVSLHARAQEDVLKVFEDIKNNIHVIYTTHSPHLVDINKLHRVLAVQRDDVENQRSATTILDAAKLSNASPDTLSPLQSIMGNPVGNQEFSVDKFNIIVNDVGSYYLLTAAMKLTGYKGKIHFIPSVDYSSIPLMCNILMGWGMKFAVLLFNNPKELGVANELKSMAFVDEPGKEDVIIIMPEGIKNAEDLFSTLDFKNFILHSREGITTLNSEYIVDKELPRNFLLSKFLSDVNLDRVKRDDLDEETRENLVLIVNVLQKY
jgi:AAA15 family ATPase/GTPase